MTIYADSPDIANHVIKCHKEANMDKKNGVSVILFVAKMIADCKIRDGVGNHEIHAACPQHPLSGLQRLRELAKRFTLSDCCWLGIYAYEYRHNRYYPTAAFKKFCKQFIKNRLASS